MIQNEIERAGGLAEQLSVKIYESNGNLSFVYYKIEEIFTNYRKTGENINLIMPSLYDVDIDQNHTNRDGRSIWVAYADVLHEELCNPDGAIHRKIKSDLNTTGTSLVLFIIELLRLPRSSAMMIAPMAASILGLGVKAFCKHSSDERCD